VKGGLQQGANFNVCGLCLLFAETIKNNRHSGLTLFTGPIATQEVIEELIKLAKQLSAADQRGVDLKLSNEEIALYDALANNQSAKEAMGDEKLRVILTELVTQVRKSTTIDWTLREGAQAKIRVIVKRILNRFGYPLDLQEAAVKEVLAQAALLCADWAQ